MFINEVTKNCTGKVLCKITLRQNITIRGGRYGGAFEVYLMSFRYFCYYA